MQTTSLSLADLLRRVKDEQLTIPQFQRSFVWRESQVRLLVDSLSRGYPIGSLLVMDKAPDLTLQSRSVDAVIREGFPPDSALLGGGERSEGIDKSRTESYILDGQQRVTSIARVFLNAHPSKLYYFDLKELLERHFDEEDSWIRTRALGKSNRRPDRKDRNRLLRADLVLEPEKALTYVSEYVDDSDDFPEHRSNRGLAREATAKINAVFETIRNYKVPVVTLDRDHGVESICRVFETINSTGTRLRTFDLAIARFFPEPDLRELWEETLRERPKLKDFDVDGERVLQVLWLWVKGQEGEYPDPSRARLLNLDPATITEKWDGAARLLEQAYQWAVAQGAKPETAPSASVLVAMAAVQGLLGDDPSNERQQWPDEALMSRWYFSKVIQGGAAQASNYRIGQDFMALREWVENGVRPTCDEVTLNGDMILKLKPWDVRYKSLLNLLSKTVREDLISGGMLEGEVHDHHIFPSNARRTLGLGGDKLDSIANRVPILALSNQRIGEGYPAEYFADLVAGAKANGTMGGLARRMRDCLIPGTPMEPDWLKRFEPDQFDTFCAERARLIIGRVREVVGESLKTEVSDDEVAEQDED